MSPAVPDLRQLKTFPQLVSYLEEQLDWPLSQYGFDELTFAYDPAELGLRQGEAAKISAIHQLRPLSHQQPWGIFFVEFEHKRLPIGVLRRILNHLVIKQRAAAQGATQARWQAEDLLFISAFGDEAGDQRELAFAHFHQEQPADLPTLRVLGWDGADTPLKLEHVAHTLKQRLRWPDNPADHAAWREQWGGAFRHRVGHVIRTADLLARELADLARGIRDRCQVMLAAESERGPLTRLYKAFQASLIHDLTPEGFADTYAQTITYGLLTAAISRTDLTGGSGTALIAENVTDMVPITNPFLKEMLQEFLRVGGRNHGIDFDELGIQDVVELLRDAHHTDLPAVLRDFGNKSRGEDPVIHFYEHFLSAYNKRLKIQRGVFYTPQPVVSYIVRSVHELLQTEFGLADGLADTTTWGEMLQRHPGLKLPPLTDEPGERRTISPDEPFVQILDPATGTATFLVEVIDVIHRTLEAKWKQQRLTDAQQRAAWNAYVPRHLLPRLHAYELMMAPYAIAHMKIGLKLAETGYRFGTEERARIYLTNALEPWVKQLPLIGFDALAHEAAAVNEIKRHKLFTVVIGNPPYANFGMLNRNPFILGLLEDYKRGLDEKKLNLDDDFIKFVRFAQHLLDRSGVGVFGMITNSTFLDGLTHRQMRSSLCGSFSGVSVLDLHGSSKRQEKNPSGGADENVFDIQTGVAVTLLLKSDAAFVPEYSELWGAREQKYEQLNKSSHQRIEWTHLSLDPIYRFFRPKEMSSAAEFQTWPALKECFRVGGCGIKTERDRVSIHWSRQECQQAVEDFRTLSEDALRTKYHLETDSRDWKVANAKADVRVNLDESLFRRVLYRPFDVRHIWYSGQTRGFVGTPAYPTMRHLLDGRYLALLTCRQQAELGFYHAFCTTLLAECCTVSLKTREITSVFPLYLLPNEDAQDSLALRSEREPNFTPAFLRALVTALSLKATGEHGLPSGVTPEYIFHYIYAVFHSPGYRSRYAEFLKIDFPRLPLTGSLELFRALARLGGELVALHLLESPRLAQPITAFVGNSRVVTKVGYAEGTVWLDAGGSKGSTRSGSSGFRGVPEAVWRFHIGGYQVCEKWLKDRKGRTLSDEDVVHYHKIVVALAETIRLMAEIDQVIAAHGGWPAAFTGTPPA
jgi:hypothetical protein